MPYQKTTATNKLRQLTKRIRGVSGGTSASKTISILLILIDYAQSVSGETISVVSESMPHLKRGAIRDFLNIMQEHHYFKDDLWNRTDMIYRFETGSIIEFFSADQPGKVRGPRRDVLFINEANNISYETFTQLEIRTKKTVWLDWNPVSEFWFYSEVKPTRDVDFLILTYKDNEALEKEIIQSIESRRHNKNWWLVYGEGQLGEVEGKIYKGWLPIDDVPPEARLKRKGLDFGYSNDPSALIDIYTWNNSYIWDEVLYRKGLSNKDIADVILHGDDALTIADSSEPKSIDEIKSYGVSILPSHKGQGSVLQGIQYLQDQTIYVTKRSINIWKEYRNYLWLTDKDGTIINEPQDFLNHCFIGDTPIFTRYGNVKIKDIKMGDKVYTSDGERTVLKQWSNGKKQVNRYSLQFDTFSVILVCTPDHLVKTTQGWIKISQLQSDQTIYLNKYLMVNAIISTRRNDISQEVQSECTQRSGNIPMAQYLMDIMSTIKTRIHGTIELITSFYLAIISTYLNTQRLSSQPIQNGQKNFRERVLKWQDFGMQPMRENLGIASMLNSNGGMQLSQNISVNSVGNIIKQNIKESQNFVTQTAKLKHLDIGEGWSENVYDLTVDKSHEYFANGVLVHNCMDAGRYGMESLKTYEGDDSLLPNDQAMFSNGWY